jgi:ribonuclease HI
MTINAAAPLAQTHAQALLTHIRTLGLNGELGRAIQYGHKFSVTGTNDIRYHAILYVGKAGPRLVAEGLAWPVELWQTISAHLAGSVAVPRPKADSLDLITQDPGSTVIYVDGSYVESDHRQTVGWAFEVWQAGQSRYRSAGSFDASHAAGTRNIAGECYAVLAALDWCERTQLRAIECRHDYTGLAHWARGTWQATTALTQHFAATLRRTGIAIAWTKVEAHRGEVGNSRVDEAARRAATYRESFTDNAALLHLTDLFSSIASKRADHINLP